MTNRELQPVSAAQMTKFPVEVILAPVADAKAAAKRILNLADKQKLQAVVKFAVSAVGSEAALAEAKRQVAALGYNIRSANMRSGGGVLVYVTGKI